MTTHQYKDLIVWQKSMNLVESVYAVSSTLPEDEKFGLVSQMRRCVISIPSNIAEGSRRGSKKDYRKFVLIAFGSGAELETQLLIAKRLQYINQSKEKEVCNLLDQIMRMLNKLQSTLKE